MRVLTIGVTSFAVLTLAACRNADKPGDTLSRQAGRVAYKTAEQVGKVAKKAGTEIKKDAIEMKKGWKEASQDSKKAHK
jgi:hypothetical protein